jgi:ABC-type nitrate/sulfonate/bicarbonate transport system substrate-binding protein
MMSNKMKHIRVGGVPEHFNLPWHLCIENKEFESHDINLTWTDFHGGTGEMSEALKNDDVDVAVMLTEGSIKEICEGNPFKILQSYVQTPLMWGIHVDANSKHHVMKDLRGKTAAISRYGSGSHLMTYVNSNNNNWDTKHLDFKIIKNLNGAVESLTEGTSDYFLWEHFTTKPLVDKGIFRRIDDVPSPWPCFVIVTTETFIKNNSEVIPAILKPLNQESKAFKTIENIEDLVSKRYQLKIEDVKQWLSITEWSQKQISEDDVFITQKKLIDLGLISKGKTYSEIIY